MGRPGVARRPSRGVLRAIILVLLALCISGALAYTARSVHDLAASCIDSDTCAPAGDPCKPHGTRVVLGSGQTCICRSGTVLASSFSGDPVCITVVRGSASPAWPCAQKSPRLQQPSPPPAGSRG